MRAVEDSTVFAVSKSLWLSAGALAVLQPLTSTIPTAESTERVGLFAAFLLRARREGMGIRPVYKTVDTCGAEFEAAPEAICGSCLGPLEPLYPASRRLPGRAEIATRASRDLETEQLVIPADKLILSSDCGFGRQGFNRTVALKDAWAKIEKRGGQASAPAGPRK